MDGTDDGSMSSAAMYATILDLQSRLAELERKAADETPPATPVVAATDSTVVEDEPVSRRSALRTAGVLAAGALAGGVASVAAASPAAAAPGTFDGNPAVTATAAVSGGVGVNASGLSVGVRATANSGGGTAFETGGGQYGFYTANTTVGIVAATTETAIVASSQNGSGANLSGIIYGVVANGYTADMLLYGAVGPPAGRGNAVNRGSLAVDSNTGDLWYCTVDGTPGTWQKLGGPGVAGAFHSVTPGRVYDSRKSSYPQNGPLSSTQNRTLSVANSYDANGVLLTTNFVPAGATAVMANITIVETVGSGFLTVNPGGVTTTNSSTINWSANGQILANGLSLTLNASRQVTVVNGSAGSTQFIIDITGYWL